jgi:beta-galactosidase/beta-glucuronidase
MHLKGPWDFQRLDRDEPEGRAVMPMAWRELFGTEAGRVEFRRKFNMPTNLEAHEHVWIVFDGIGGEAAVSVNREPLGHIAVDQSKVEFEITPFLNVHNELCVDLNFDPALVSPESGGLWGPVALEIRFDDAKTPDPNWSPKFRAT